RAQYWVSSAPGSSDGNTCLISQPCFSFQGALSAINSARGTLSVLNPGNYGIFKVEHSITIANDISATAVICCGSQQVGGGSPSGMVLVIAAPDDVVTLRGLTIDGTSGTSGIVILNAKQVNIEKCTIRSASHPGILIAPFNN